MKYKILMIAAAAVQACGAALFKLGTAQKNVLLLAATLAVFCGGFALYYRCLSGLKLSVAQPLFSSAMFLTTTLISIVFFHDAISVHRAAGIVAIVGGMVVISAEKEQASIAQNKTGEAE